MENARPSLYRQSLALHITIEHSVDPADGVKPVESMEPDRFKGNIFIQAKKDAIKEAKKILARPGYLDARIKA